MKIGINARVEVFGGEEDLFRALHEAGFDCIDFLAERNPDDNTYAKKILSLSKRYGIEISQTHLPIWINSSEDEFLSERFVGSVIKGIYRTAELGVRYAVVHPYVPQGMERFLMGRPYDYSVYREKNFRLNMEFFGKIAPAAKDAGVVLCIENLFAHDLVLGQHVASACSDPAETLAYIEELGAPFAACYDTGHHNLHGGNPEQYIKAVGSHLKVLHVNNSFGKELRGFDWHLMPGQGDVDFPAVLGALRKIGFDGTFSYEVHLDKDLKTFQLEYLARAARRLIELYFK